MSRGGARPGSGPKPGSKNRATVARELRAQGYQQKAAEKGILPLDCMLETMNELWRQGDKMGACAIAKEAAPYVHSRLASTEVQMHSDNVHVIISDKPMTEAEWCAAYNISYEGNDSAAGVVGNGAAADDKPGAA